MPTIFTHAVVPLAIAVAAGSGRVSPKLALAGVAFAMLPDADVAAFKFGIAYEDTWGHRGATHALAFAAVCAGAVSLVWEEARSWFGFAFLTLAMASHGLLDAATDGGLGAALLWPFSDARIFAPFAPVRVPRVSRRVGRRPCEGNSCNSCIKVGLGILGAAAEGFQKRFKT